MFYIILNLDNKNGVDGVRTRKNQNRTLVPYQLGYHPIYFLRASNYWFDALSIYMGTIEI